MCGIAGFVDFSLRHSSESLSTTALTMARSVRHRGRDDEGVWSDAAAGVSLAMSRLAILDPSPAGHQPMRSESGRYVLVTNGEIYNCEELREQVSARDPQLRFAGHSDTEVMLAAIECWGVREAIFRFNGMFAFALWDRAERRLHLGRDRFGEKPLYYSRTSRSLIFGSELKALRLHPDFSGDIDRGAIALFLRYNCIPAPWTVYTHAAKLPPGTLLTIDRTCFQNAAPIPYWSAEEDARNARENPFVGSEAEATEQLDALLRDAVRLRMRSDVPLGAFLSGGVDSSTVVALMQAQSARPVKTFSIGVEDRNYNEAPEAASVGRHLGTDHTELYVTPTEAMSVIPTLATIFDEPFADSSQIPTYLVARLARQQVKVSLSGDGGDELFGGYNRHVWGRRLMRVPRPIRSITGHALKAIDADGWDSLFRRLQPLLPNLYRLRMPGYKMHKLASVLTCSEDSSFYGQLISHWTEPNLVVLPGDVGGAPSNSGDGDPVSVEHMMLMDATTYLPDDILVKLDRATMAVNLEARVPFLDAQVFQFAFRLPLSMKIRNGTGKWIVRRVLSQYLPPIFVDRPKAGFGIPLDSWLAGPLRDWCEDLLDEHHLRHEGILNPAPIREKWARYLAGETFWAWHLWDVLMLQSWLDAHRTTPSQLANCCPQEPCCVQPRT